MSTRSLNDIASQRLIVGLEVHVELATRRKMFSRAPSPACADSPSEHAPNSLVDEVVLALPGSLPVMNREAVELSMLVGLALGCNVARHSKWDRKNYFYPDMPKAYQISQYDMPLCADGHVDLPATDALGLPDFSQPSRRIGIIRAHLEEDAGKLLHEAPGGGSIDFSIIDLNRAGTPLLEIVTQPDFRSADEVVLFARLLWATCRHLGVTRGVLQDGHVRFEPNINLELTLRDGRLVRTPVVEVKNLNSFRSLRGAVEFEQHDQARRWVQHGREHGPGAKTTRGWDDSHGVTFAQREKEDAEDYRYFPDPDLPSVHVDDAWLERVRARLVEPPAARMKRIMSEAALASKEAWALVEEPGVAHLHEQSSEFLVRLGIERSRASRLCANFILQTGMKVANERGVSVEQLGWNPAALAAVGALRERGEIAAQSVEPLLLALHESTDVDRDVAAQLERARSLATLRGFVVRRDAAALAAWVQQTIADNAKTAEDVRAGKLQAVGRLVGEVMKLSGGSADAKLVREELLRQLRG